MLPAFRILILALLLPLAIVACGIEGPTPTRTPAPITQSPEAGGEILNVSMTIGNDGLPLISFRQGTRLRVAHCEDPDCSSATISTLDDSVSSSITTGGDGFALLAYVTGNPLLPDTQALKIGHCKNVACTEASSTTVEGSRAGSLTAGADGRGLIAFVDNAGELKAAHCLDDECSRMNVFPLGIRDHALATAITTGSDGMGLIVSVHGPTTLAHRVTKCLNRECSTAASNSLLSATTASESSVTTQQGRLA